MLSYIRHSTSSRVLGGLMALYLLNISVDTADPNPEHIPEDLSINDQESIIEIFVEKILGFENAIKEYDDHDTEEHNKKKNHKTKIVLPFSCLPDHSIFCLEKGRQRYPWYSVRSAQGYGRLESPPPEV